MARSSAPAVTVVTPTKNRLKLLGEAIESVQAQTFADWEQVIVDDGSDDGTVEDMARRTAADPRLRYFQRQGEKGGANVCRNQGLGHARGDFVVFLDSDDVLDPHCLGQRVEAMRRNADLDFATFATGVFIKERGDIIGEGIDNQILGDDLLRFLHFELPWIITAPIWRRSALERLGGFDEALPSWQDVDLHLRALTSGARYLRFPDIDHHVRWQWEDTKVSIEQRRSPRHLEAAHGSLEKFERLVREGPGINWPRQRAFCSLYFFLAERWVDSGHPAQGLDCWKQIRRRRLGPSSLYVSGAVLLFLRALGGPFRKLSERISHKWKGWARLRLIPEIVT